eukprot:Seg2294.4 transcript_id=Seg2294.4/GoldUCD/mRNA.D3Y31 product="39S ribosomal protein L18 mitochondrial" pseudo=true protein_id=Seg2294.4/GoldUCD/D3Y31
MNIPATLRITASLRTFGKQLNFSYSRLFASRASHDSETRGTDDLGHLGPKKRQDTLDLKRRGLRSLTKFVDKRKGEHLKPDAYTSKWGSVRRGTQDKFKIENDIPDMPAETQLQTRNRNPRNLELLGYNKPKGYGTLYKRRDFWNRLNLVISNNHITAFVDHHTGEILVSASTQEFAISRHLWRNNDTAAAMNVGRIIADRCKECGIERVFWWMKAERKMERALAFMEAVKEQGMLLTEPRRVVLPHYHVSDIADFKPKKKKSKFFTASMKRKHTYF